MNNSTSIEKPSENSLICVENGLALTVKRVIPPPAFIINVSGHVFELTKGQAIELRDKLESILASEHTDPIISAVLSVIPPYFGLSVAQMMSKNKQDKYVRSRNYAIQVCYDLGCRNVSELGRAFNRDHGTILHALSVNKERLAVYPTMKRELEFLRDEVEVELLKGTRNHEKAIHERGPDTEKD